MSVLTLVHRALPFSFPWKRRQSTSTSSSKGKERDRELETTSSEHDSQNEPQIGSYDAEIPDAPLDCDVSHTLHIAVKQRLGPDASRNDSQNKEPAGDHASDSESDSTSDCKTHRLAEKCEPSARPQLARVVSWASIVRSRCRWTCEQEKKLVDAERQLARCQKAWSSEQELWLAYVCHEFLLLFCTEIRIWCLPQTRFIQTALTLPFLSLRYKL